jgi:hypothetical protein
MAKPIKPPPGFVPDPPEGFEPDNKGFVPDKNSMGGYGGITSEPVSGEYEKELWIRENLKNGNIEEMPKSFWQKIYAELPQIAGEEVGAAAGAYAGARGAAKMPAGHPLLKGLMVAGGAVVGAGMGAMGAKGYEQSYRMSEPGSKIGSLDDVYREQLWAGAEGAISEALGRGVVGGGQLAWKTGIGKKALAPFKKDLIPGIEKLDAILKRAGRTLPPKEAAKLTEHSQQLLNGTGAFLTAAQMTKTRPVDFIENAVEQSMFGGNRLFQLKRLLQPTTYKHAVKEMSDRFWKEAGQRMSPAEAGNLFVNTITNRRGTQRSLENIAFTQMGKLTSGGKHVIPDLSSVQKLAKEIGAVADVAGGTGQQRQIRALANKVQKWGYTHGDDANYFMQAHSLRSNLLDEIRSMEMKEGRTLGKVRGQYKRISAAMTSSMEDAARKAGPREYTAWKAARKFTADGAAELDSEAINAAMRFARRKPEMVTGKVFTKYGVDTLETVKNAVGRNSPTYKTLLASYLDDVITRHSGLSYETRMVPSGTRILDFMDKNLGDDMIQAMFTSPRHVQDFKDVMELGFILERTNQAGGGMLIQLLQAGGVADIGTKMLAGDAPKAASWAITAGPAVLGRLFANPAGARWLSTGAKLSGKAQERWFAKLPPSMMRIIREGTQPPREETRSYRNRWQGLSGLSTFK